MPMAVSDWSKLPPCHNCGQVQRPCACDEEVLAAFAAWLYLENPEPIEWVHDNKEHDDDEHS